MKSFKNSGQFQKGHIPYNKGMKRSEETKRKISLAKKGKNYPNAGQFQKGNKSWNEGMGEYIKLPRYENEKIHREARELFGHDCCEFCQVTNEEHIEKYGQPLGMHCENEKYDLIKGDWWTLCKSCHSSLHQNRKADKIR